MLRRSFPLLAIVLLSACGSSDSPDAPNVAVPKSTGPMTVAPTDGRVGDATTATSAEGLRELSKGKRTSPDVLKQGVGAGAACADTEVLPTAENLAVIAAATICLVNGERADAGLPALSDNGKLTQSSLGHSQDMVAKSYFAHNSQDGRDVVDRVKATGYIPTNGEWTVGENLAWGTGTLATPKGIVQAWMNSQGHRENILRSGFREAGLGIVTGNPRSADGQGATYTMNFGAVGSTTAQQLASSVAAPKVSSSTRTAAAKRSAAKRKRTCRARARKARASSVRKARMARCARASRRR
jgi:uncharacterized protein YkwD